jgi:hypothetical protein
MIVDLTTPALLFPAISLLLLAYTNRFLAVAAVIRELHKNYRNDPQSVVKGQLQSLRTRMYLTRSMQLFGLLSFVLCVLSMFLIYLRTDQSGSYIFGASLVLLLVSLIISMREIQLSTKALDLELSDMELGSKLRF